MDTRRNHAFKATLLLGGVALAVAACGSGSGATTTSGSGSTGSAGSSGAVVMTETVSGTKALVDATGKTLYSTTAESGGQIKCVDGCTSFWKPLMASKSQAQQASMAEHQTFSVVSRPDGGSQLTYKGLPLYTFTQEGAHSMKGDGFSDDFQGTHFTWKAAVTSGSPTAAPSSSSGGGNGGYGGGYSY